MGPGMVNNPMGIGGIGIPNPQQMNPMSAMQDMIFNNLYQNYAYQKYIRPTLMYNERFFIESEGVKFDYNLHRSLLLKIINKIVIGFKKYYICNKEEEINEDFKCRT